MPYFVGWVMRTHFQEAVRKTFEMKLLLQAAFKVPAFYRLTIVCCMCTNL